MLIGLNLLPCLPEIRGGWNYVGGLLGALADYECGNTYIAFVTRHSEDLVPARPNFVAVGANIRSSSRLQRVVYENSWLQLLARKYRLDCMHWFANAQGLINVVPGVVTVYDLHSFRKFAEQSLVKRFYTQSMMSQTGRSARMLLPISESTAQELTNTLKVRGVPITVIPPCLSSHFGPCVPEEAEDFRHRHNLPPKFWLYVAHLLKYKNHLGLLAAYHQLKSLGFEPWPLVLRGEPNEEETAAEVAAEIKTRGLDRDVIFLPQLGYDELPVMYSAATALVHPSFYEGAGLPVLEAMACGCPVVASRIPAVIEFAGTAATYFDPTDIGGIRDAIRNFQGDPAGYEMQRSAGLARAEEFRPHIVARSLIDAYEKSIVGPL